MAFFKVYFHRRIFNFESFFQISSDNFQSYLYHDDIGLQSMTFALRSYNQNTFGDLATFTSPFSSAGLLVSNTYVILSNYLALQNTATGFLILLYETSFGN